LLKKFHQNFILVSQSPETVQCLKSRNSAILGFNVKVFASPPPYVPHPLFSIHLFANLLSFFLAKRRHESKEAGGGGGEPRDLCGFGKIGEWAG